MQALDDRARLADWQRAAIHDVLRSCRDTDIVTIDCTSDSSFSIVVRYTDKGCAVGVEHSIERPTSASNEDAVSHPVLLYRVCDEEVAGNFSRLRALILSGPARSFGGGNHYRAHATLQPCVLIDGNDRLEYFEEGAPAPSIGIGTHDPGLNGVDAACIDAYIEAFDTSMRAISFDRK